MPTELPLNAGTLPSPYTCWQALYELMFSLGSADGPTLTGLLIQDATPAAEDHDKGWIPTVGGVPRFPGYVFVWHATLGHWVSRHYIASNDESRSIYVGTSASIQTYDGGDADPAGTASGAMWEIDTLFNGRVAVGAGTIPGTAAVSIAVKGTIDSDGKSGEYAHVLTEAELAAHTHVTNITRDTGADVSESTISAEGTAGTVLPWTSESTGGDEGHNTMQPYYGVYFLKRTARAFYVAA